MSAQGERPALDFGLSENIYGHVKRLEWIALHLRSGDRVLEIGCGTGYMITLPLVRSGWDAMGVDVDVASIDYGRGVMTAERLDPERLQAVDAARLSGQFDAIIVSEVLEHLSDDGIRELLTTVSRLLAPGGRLLVTVPNGYGAFEVENFLWRRLGLGPLLRMTRIQDVVERLKMRFAADQVVYDHPSSLDSSPHKQRFTMNSVCARLRDAGFDVGERRATVLVAGPISNLLFTGVRSVTRLNRRLGDLFPVISTAFMVSATCGTQDR
jgi:2-polyprenyl-3-methyl-5-hydroxy-6-metoxy-1,4-benzoquinol methylase